MQLNIENRVGARFKLIAHKGDGRPTRETGWFHNLVLNTGLDRMSVGTWIDRCCIGAGNSNPIETQTQLDNFLASTTSNQGYIPVSNLGSPPYYYGIRQTWRFAQGSAAGNISEIGLGWGNAQLWNRALVKDLNGDPTTITVLSDEFLDVVAEVRIYPGSGSGSFNLTDKLGEIKSTHSYQFLPSIGSITKDFEKIAITRASFFSGDISSSVSGLPSGNETMISGQLSNNYESPRSVTATLNLPIGVAVFEHKSLLMAHNLLTNNSVRFQLQINPPIIKTNAQIMTYTFKMSWGRYESP